MTFKCFKRPSSNHGFTLIELMIVVVIVAILAVIAVPGFFDLIAKNKVKAAAEDVYGLVLQAKSEAPIRDTNISVSIATGTGASWCVGLNETAGCDCSSNTTTECFLNVGATPVLRVVRGGDHPDTTLSIADFSGSGPTFELPRNGVNDDGEIQITNGNWALNVEISDEGRVKVCNPNSNAMPGYEGC